MSEVIVAGGEVEMIERRIEAEPVAGGFRTRQPLGMTSGPIPSPGIAAVR